MSLDRPRMSAVWIRGFRGSSLGGGGAVSASMLRRRLLESEARRHQGQTLRFAKRRLGVEMHAALRRSACFTSGGRISLHGSRRDPVGKREKRQAEHAKAVFGDDALALDREAELLLHRAHVPDPEFPRVGERGEVEAGVAQAAPVAEESR